MAANTSRTVSKSGNEFRTIISELNLCIDELDRWMKELSARGGDRTEEEMEKINDAIEFFNGKQMEVKNTLKEFDQLGAYAYGTRMVQISVLNSVFEELGRKVTKLLPGETRLDEAMKKKGKMKRGGESSSTNVPDDVDPIYLENVQLIKLHLDLLKETMKTFTKIVEINQGKMNRDSASRAAAEPDREEPPRCNV